ncbi:hypothetical protein KZ483_12875 [Paenibacillus sp. sptzw28]|uniref:hypothetical protein n=1 Tax=Paenibacillus sp. sptzw28 TaxID=715179 RepID=UPI001C6E5ADC|nr:hypothetical protein [Paenibacillus sp. sptzw28]QYR23704.1 hypothetical protein KZ483_12875 [Paenibacillus sp. sptzw28]
MGERLKNGLIILLYSMGAGLMLAIFSSLRGGINIVFSLLALIIGVLFFRKFPKISTRIIFILLAILFFLLIVIIITMIIYLKRHPGGSPVV